jgi:hypothetical protein
MLGVLRLDRGNGVEVAGHGEGGHPVSANRHC